MALTTGGMPMHRQIFLVIRDQIATGSLRPGDALPSEEALGRLYDVSRITVRRALQDLTEQGYVRRRQGRGTFVAEHPDAGLAHPQSLRATLHRVQAETQATLIEYEQRAAPPAIAQALNLDTGATALYIVRVRSQRDRPIMLTEAWLPSDRSAAVTAEGLRQHALYELLEAAGHQLGRSVQEISAQIADPTRARLLDTDIGAALLRIDRLVHDRNGDPLMRNTILADARRSRIISDISAGDIDTAATGVLVHGDQDSRVNGPVDPDQSAG
jgi:GntR family transcriptional regulator